MPQTKFQDLTFTCIMVLIFVYVMTFYNAGLENGSSAGYLPRVRTSRSLSSLLLQDSQYL